MRFFSEFANRNREPQISSSRPVILLVTLRASPRIFMPGIGTPTNTDNCMPHPRADHLLDRLDYRMSGVDGR